MPLGTPIRNPKVTPQFGCVKQPLKKLCEQYAPTYRYCNNGVVIDYSYQKSRAMNLFDPRSPYGTIESAVGFVTWKSKFIVWDNLQVTPLVNTSSIAFLQKLNIPLDDLEEHEVRIGKKEVNINPLLNIDTSKYTLMSKINKNISMFSGTILVGSFFDF